ncbi:MAG: amidohydrolase [Phycisphaerae bacterium]
MSCREEGSRGPFCEQLLLGARVHALDGVARRDCDAVLIRGDRVVAVGNRKRLAAAAGRNCRRVDFGDATLTPGLVDCHTHFFYWALNRALVIDLSACTSLEETLGCIRRGSRSRRVGEWIVARGFDCNAWPRGWPSAADLDRAVPGIPVMARSRDGHSAWLNTRALRTCSVSRDRSDPPGGSYDRDEHGEPTGIVREAAIDRLPNPVRDFAMSERVRDRDAIDRALDDASRVARSFGIVGVHVLDDAASLAAFQRRHAASELGLRVVHSIPGTELENARRVGLRSGLGDDRLRIGGVKFFSDGALGSQTAYMFEPYPGRGEYRGVPVVAGEELREAVAEAARAGWVAWIHAIGDRAVSESIDAIAEARRVELGQSARQSRRRSGEASPRITETPPPHRIEHAQCVRPRDVRRMARLGIVASVQPCHIPQDIANADRYWPNARRYAHPLRALRDAGVRLAMGSDVPVETIDPRVSLHAATTRVDAEGRPTGGWYPDERVSALDALRGFTLGSSLIPGATAPRGRLVPGALADLTIWRDDPLRAPPEALRDIRIAGVMIGGTLHLTDE